MAITKILIRQGTDVQRRTADSTGVILDRGEPGYCIDTKRLFIGDGITPGGSAIGIQNLGTVTSLFGNYQNGFTNEAINIFTLSGAAVGDIIYDYQTRSLYTLSSVNTFPPQSSEMVKFDFLTLINTDQLEYDSNAHLQIKTRGITPQLLDYTCFDGTTITKPSLAAPITIADEGIKNQHLQKVAAYTLKGNFINQEKSPQDLYVKPFTVVGRADEASPLSCIPFTTLAQTVALGASNGIVIDSQSYPQTISIDSRIFGMVYSGIDIPASIEVNLPISFFREAVFRNTVVMNSILTVQDTIRCTGDIIGYYNPSDIALKEDLQPIESPLKKILNLTGYTFKWRPGIENSDILQGKDYGIIAQDVEKILPEAVMQKKNGLKSVSYIKLIPLLIECIKELKQELTELKNESKI